MKKRNDPRKAVTGILALALFALTGCSAQNVNPGREQSSCELSLNGVCASAIDSYLAAETARPVKAASSKTASLEPLVAPVNLPDGELATEVDCYVNFDRKGSWLVYAHVAIAPSSPEAVEHLRDHDLCENASPERRLASGPIS
jgi:hypothetical protein